MTSRAAWISSKWFSEYTPSANIGDVDGDGEVTVMDATLVQKYIASLETLTDSQFNVADVNGDGEISVLDATQIQKIVVNLV